MIVVGKRSEVGRLKDEYNRIVRGALRVYRGPGIPGKDEKVEAAALEMTVSGMRIDGGLGLLGVGRAQICAPKDDAG